VDGAKQPSPRELHKRLKQKIFVVKVVAKLINVETITSMLPKNVCSARKNFNVCLEGKQSVVHVLVPTNILVP